MLSVSRKWGMNEWKTKEGGEKKERRREVVVSPYFGPGRWFNRSDSVTLCGLIPWSFVYCVLIKVVRPVCIFYEIFFSFYFGCFVLSFFSISDLSANTYYGSLSVICVSGRMLPFACFPHDLPLHILLF